MLGFIKKKGPFVLSNVGVMIVLHGNSKQFWPKIPYLSLRDESIPEHIRLLFNALLVVTAGQVLFRRMPTNEIPARAVSMGTIPLMLPILLRLGEDGLELEGNQARAFHLSLVLILPLVAAMLEEAIVALIESQQ